MKTLLSSFLPENPEEMWFVMKDCKNKLRSQFFAIAALLYIEICDKSRRACRTCPNKMHRSMEKILASKTIFSEFRSGPLPTNN